MSYAARVVAAIERLRARERYAGRMQALVASDPAYPLWQRQLERAESDCEVAYGDLLNALADNQDDRAA